MTTNAVPNPGSDAAFARGCTCARMDNHYGKGIISYKDGSIHFWISGDCPLHGRLIHPADATQEVKP